MVGSTQGQLRDFGVHWAFKAFSIMSLAASHSSITFFRRCNSRNSEELFSGRITIPDSDKTFLEDVSSQRRSYEPNSA